MIQYTRMKLGSKELRKTPPQNNEHMEIKRNPIYLIVDSVLDTYNIGSLFRLADAIAVEKMYLCGDMQYPPNSRIHKASVGTEEWVPWEKRDSAVEVINELKEKGVYTIAVEQDPRAISHKLLADSLRLPVAVVVGHETTGVTPEALDAVDQIIELPMYGVNKSFNVWGSAAVVLYRISELL